MTEAFRPRAIRSFVVRGGRITEAQERALQALWPRYGVDFSQQHLDLDTVFGRSARRVLEIGFGNGENLLALAAAHPDQDFLGIEVHPPGVGRVLLTAEKLGLTNVRTICHDAVEVLHWQIPRETLDEVQILFPDPWHKKRHHKRRLIQEAFVELLVDRIRPQGVLRLATDWQHYAEQMLDVLNRCARLTSLSPESGFVPRHDERPLTRFELRGERLGHDVWDLAFRRETNLS